MPLPDPLTAARQRDAAREAYDDSTQSDATTVYAIIECIEFWLTKHDGHFLHLGVWLFRPQWEAVIAALRQRADQGDLTWQVEQWRSQYPKIIGQWHNEKRRADAAEKRVNALSEALTACKRASCDPRSGWPEDTQYAITAIVDAALAASPAPALDAALRPTPDQAAFLDATQTGPTGHDPDAVIGSSSPASDTGRCWSELDMG
jgi:hypothetical protein